MAIYQLICLCVCLSVRALGLGGLLWQEEGGGSSGGWLLPLMGCCSSWIPPPDSCPSWVVAFESRKSLWGLRCNNTKLQPWQLPESVSGVVWAEKAFHASSCSSPRRENLRETIKAKKWLFVAFCSCFPPIKRSYIPRRQRNSKNTKNNFSIRFYLPITVVNHPPSIIIHPSSNIIHPLSRGSEFCVCIYPLSLIHHNPSIMIHLSSVHPSSSIHLPFIIIHHHLYSILHHHRPSSSIPHHPSILHPSSSVHHPSIIPLLK